MALIRFVRRLRQIRRVRGSAEFALAIDCCRRNFRGAAPWRPNAGIDWQRFLALVHFHRIEGLAHKALSENPSAAPRQVYEQLAQAAAAIAAQNLRAAAESRSLREGFAAAAVPLLFLKGLTLGALAYGNPARKSAIDIDLLIDPNDLGAAAHILRETGFELVAPRASKGDRILHFWHRSWKESVWRKRETATQIDLHTRTADNARLIPSINVHSPCRKIEIGSGIALPTLAPDELFAYLTVHGASSAWFRLKWVSDFAALLTSQPGREIHRLYDRSQELGAGRAAGQALLLADHLFELLADMPDLKRSLTKDRVTRRLFRIARDLVCRPPKEPTEGFLGTLPIHASQMLLMPGSGYKVAELSRQAARLRTRGLA
jgi:hypothetical protein